MGIELATFPNTFSLLTNTVIHQCSVYQDVMIYTTWRFDAMESLQEPQNHQSQWWFYVFSKTVDIGYIQGPITEYIQAHK